MRTAARIKRSASLLLMILLLLTLLSAPTLAGKPAPVNTPPVIVQGNDPLFFSTEMNVQVIFPLNATDKEKTVMSWKVDPTDPADHGGVIFSNLTNIRGKSSITVTFTPDAGFIGSDSFIVTVSDAAGATDSILIYIQINGTVANQEPELNPIGNKSVDELALLTFTATATDPDTADSLTFSLLGAPPGAAITQDGVFTWTPSEAQGPDIFTFGVQVSDGSATDSETITVNVSEVNTAPVIDAIAAKTVNVNELLTFTATASDADLPANTLTFSLENNLPAGAAISPSGGFSWTPGTAGTYSAAIVVSDGLTTDTETFTITVNEVSTEPTEVRYVSLGDSIATGTTDGIFNPPTYPYVDQFESYLNDINEIPVYRSAFETDGDRTNELLSDLKTNTTLRNAVDAADVITVSIGGNNLMQACKTWIGYDFFNPNISLANQGYNDFVNQYDDIMLEIRALNDTATIIVMTLYNPYNIADDYMHTLVDNYYFRTDGLGMNNLIQGYADDYNYLVADAFSAFDAYSNGQMGTVTLMYPASFLRNPHPTQFGQNLLFGLHRSVYELQ